MNKMNLSLMAAAVSLISSGVLTEAKPEPETNRTHQPTRRPHNPKTRQRELMPDEQRQLAAEEKRQRKAVKRLAIQQEG